MTKEQYTNELIELNKKSYDRGFDDAISVIMESFDEMAKTGIVSLPLTMLQGMQESIILVKPR